MSCNHITSNENRPLLAPPSIFGKQPDLKQCEPSSSPPLRSLRRRVARRATLFHCPSQPFTPVSPSTVSTRVSPRRPTTGGPPTNQPAAGMIGSSTRVQEVANPGLRRLKAVAEAKSQASLQAQVNKLTAQVKALEARLAGATVAAEAAAAAEPTIVELLTSLQELTAAATGEQVSSKAIGAGLGVRPSSAPYRTYKDTASVVSWSADAFGKSKNPGWYHEHRKQLYAQRAARTAEDPKGCYISHSKYADEAVRIAATGRMAFSSGKTGGK